MMDRASGRVVLARIGAPHGIRGEVRLKPFTEDAAALAAYGPLETPEGRRIIIERLRPAGAMLIAKLEGIHDRAQAETLNGADLLVDRDRLPEPGNPDDFYHADLIGLEAVDPNGAPLGTVVAVHNFGAGDILDVVPPGGGDRRSLLIPFTREAVPDVDVAGGRIVVQAACGDRGARGGRGRTIVTPFRATVLTLYPEMFPGPLGVSLAGKALATGAWQLEVRNIREHGIGTHRAVDDTPAGGGPGMVMRADVLAAAIDAALHPDDPRPRLLMSARGRALTQAFVRDLAAGPGALIVCGRFEGVDERVIEARNLQEISIGDFILSGGEIAAMALLDACVRLIPGVMGAAASGIEESFEQALLEYPHYTRPQLWEGLAIPEVLMSGHHGRVAEWRRAEAERITAERRPDLWQNWVADQGGRSGKGKP